MKPDATKICFGLDLELDRQSLAVFLQLAGDRKFTELFSSRLSSNEILKYVDDFTGLLKKHLKEEEYHNIFLQDPNHHHNHHDKE